MDEHRLSGRRGRVTRDRRAPRGPVRTPAPAIRRRPRFRGRLGRDRTRADRRLGDRPTRGAGRVRRVPPTCDARAATAGVSRGPARHADRHPHQCDRGGCRVRSAPGRCSRGSSGMARRLLDQRAPRVPPRRPRPRRTDADTSTCQLSTAQPHQREPASGRARNPRPRLVRCTRAGVDRRADAARIPRRHRRRSGAHQPRTPHHTPDRSMRP